MQLYGALASPHVARAVLFARLQDLELDPTTGRGTLGRWWSAMQRDSITSAFLARYEPAVDAFHQSLGSR